MEREREWEREQIKCRIAETSYLIEKIRLKEEMLRSKYGFFHFRLWRNTKENVVTSVSYSNTQVEKHYARSVHGWQKG